MSASIVSTTAEPKVLAAWRQLVLPATRGEAREYLSTLRTSKSPLFDDASKAFRHLDRIQGIYGVWDPSLLSVTREDDVKLGAKLAKSRMAEQHLLGLPVFARVTPEAGRAEHRAESATSYWGKQVDAYVVSGPALQPVAKYDVHRSSVETCPLGVLEALGMAEQRVIRFVRYEETNDKVGRRVRQAYGIAEIERSRRAPVGRELGHWHQRQQEIQTATVSVVKGRDVVETPVPDWQKRVALSRLGTERIADQFGLVLAHAPVAKESVQDKHGRTVNGIVRVVVVAVAQALVDPCLVEAKDLERVYAKAIAQGDLEPWQFPNGTGVENVHYQSAYLTGLRTVPEGKGLVKPQSDVAVRLTLDAGDLYRLRHAQGLYRVDFDPQGEVALDGSAMIFAPEDMSRAQRAEGQTRVFDLTYEADTSLDRSRGDGRAVFTLFEEVQRVGYSGTGYGLLGERPHVPMSGLTADVRTLEGRRAHARHTRPSVACGTGELDAAVERIAVPETTAKGAHQVEASSSLLHALKAVLGDGSVHPGALVARRVLLALEEAERRHGRGAFVVVTMAGQQVKVGGHKLVNSMLQTDDELGDALVCSTHLRCKRYRVAASSQDTMFAPPATLPREVALKRRLVGEIAAQVDSPESLLTGVLADLRREQDNLNAMIANEEASEREIDTASLAEIEKQILALAGMAGTVDVLMEALSTSTIPRPLVKAQKALDLGLEPGSDGWAEVVGDSGLGWWKWPPVLLNRFSQLVGSMLRFVLRHTLKEVFYVNVEGPNDLASLVAHWTYFDACAQGEDRDSYVVNVPALICKLINADSDGDLLGGIAADVDVYVTGTMPQDETPGVTVAEGGNWTGRFKVVLLGRYPKVDLRVAFLLPEGTPTPYDGADDKEQETFAEWLNVHAVRADPDQAALVGGTAEAPEGPVVACRPLGIPVNDAGAKEGVAKVKNFGTLKPLQEGSRNCARVAFRKADLDETGTLTRDLERAVARAYALQAKAERFLSEDDVLNAETYFEASAAMWFTAWQLQVRIEGMLTQFKYAGLLARYAPKPNGTPWDGDLEGLHVRETMMDPVKGYPLSYHKTLKALRHVLARPSRRGDVSCEALVADMETEPSTRELVQGRSRGAEALRRVVSGPEFQSVVAGFKRMERNAHVMPFAVDIAQRLRAEAKKAGVTVDKLFTPKDLDDCDEAERLLAEWSSGWYACMQAEESLMAGALIGEEDAVRLQAKDMRDRFSNQIRARFAELASRMSLRAKERTAFRWWNRPQSRSGAAVFLLLQGDLGNVWPRIEGQAPTVSPSGAQRFASVEAFVIGASRAPAARNASGRIVETGEYEPVRTGALDGVPENGGKVTVLETVYLTELGLPTGIIVVDRPVKDADGSCWIYRIQFRARGGAHAVPAEAHARPRQPLKVTKAGVVFTFGKDQ